MTLQAVVTVFPGAILAPPVKFVVLQLAFTRAVRKRSHAGPVLHFIDKLLVPRGTELNVIGTGVPTGSTWPAIRGAEPNCISTFSGNEVGGVDSRKVIVTSAVAAGACWFC